MSKTFAVQSWPAELDSDRLVALKAAQVAQVVVDGALAGPDPDCVHEAGVRALVAFRAAQVLMLAATESPRPAGRRWSRRLSAVRSLINQNAAAGVDLVAGLGAATSPAGRRLLLDLLALLSDLVYFLDVLGRAWSYRNDNK